MAANLSKFANKTILVSIPSLSGDVKCRPYKLRGVELIGLWLESDDLASGFLGQELKTNAATAWAFFVPFSQIACVAVGMPTVPVVAGGTPSGVQSQGSSQKAPATAAGESSSSSIAASRKKTKGKEG